MQWCDSSILGSLQRNLSWLSPLCAQAALLAGYSMVYIFMQTFAIPGTVSLSLLSGALFGVARGLILVAGSSVHSVVPYRQLIGQRNIKSLCTLFDFSLGFVSCSAFAPHSDLRAALTGECSVMQWCQPQGPAHASC